MKSKVELFRLSVENDMTVHAEELNFLDLYTIDSMACQSPEISIYNLSAKTHKATLLVTKKTSSEVEHSSSNYFYRILKSKE